MASALAKSATCLLKGSTKGIMLPLKVNFQMIDFYGVPFGVGEVDDSLFQSDSVERYFQAADLYTRRLGHQNLDAFWLTYEEDSPILYYVDTLAGDLMFRIVHSVNRATLDDLPLNRPVLKKALSYLGELSERAPPWFMNYQEIIEDTYKTTLRIGTRSVTDLVLDKYENGELANAEEKLSAYCEACVKHVEGLSRLCDEATYTGQLRNTFALHDCRVVVYEPVFPPPRVRIFIPQVKKVDRDNVRQTLRLLYERTRLFYSKEKPSEETVWGMRSYATPFQFNIDYQKAVRIQRLQERYGACYYLCFLEFWILLLCGTD